MAMSKWSLADEHTPVSLCHARWCIVLLVYFRRLPSTPLGLARPLHSRPGQDEVQVVLHRVSLVRATGYFLRVWRSHRRWIIGRRLWRPVVSGRVQRCENSSGHQLRPLVSPGRGIKVFGGSFTSSSPSQALQVKGIINCCKVSTSSLLVDERDSFIPVATEKV